MVDESIKLAMRLVERLGTDEVATEALLIAAERGYSGSQILAGVASGDLRADGTIGQVNPAGAALGRIDIATKSGQSLAAVKPAKRPAAHMLASGVVKAIVWRQDAGGEKIVLEELRDAATSSGAFRYEQQQVVGLHGVSLILLMLRLGLTPEQVIDGIVLGVYFFEDDGVCYSQTLSVGKKEPVVRPCDAEQGSNGADAEATDSEQNVPDAAAPADPVQGARYVGTLDNVLLEDPQSSITVMISSEGVVTGQLNGTEQLDNYIASIDLCGILGEEPDECGDGVENCPATVLWSSDLSTLQFVGTPPDSGAVSGAITLVWDTTPDGCGEPSRETNVFEIEATVTPDGAEITAPVLIVLDRVPLEE